MLIKRPSDIRPSEITDPEIYAKRRDFLKAAALLGAGTLVSTTACSRDDPQFAEDALEQLNGPNPGKTNDLVPTSYEHVTSYNNFYEFGTDKSDPARYAGSLKTRPWSIVVDGECESPGRIDIEDILSSYPQEERLYRFRCVEAWAMVVPWLGFPLGDLLARFRPTSKAKYVAFETLYDPEQMRGQRRAVIDWPYREGLRMDEAMHPLTLLTTGLYGKPLPNQNGAPLRLIVPWKYGFKSIKSIVRISFTHDIPSTTWWKMGPSEYGFYANVNPQVDHPRWSQARHRLIGDGLFSRKYKTLMFNGYADQVAHLYKGMDLSKFY